MKYIFTFCFVVFSFALLSQSTGDTIVVKTFNYSQTHGSGIRDTMIDFPDNPGITYEKVIMLYNMRCKKGLVSTTTDRNKGCGEWDYSCNTYITDSSKVDSVLSFTNSHYISAFSGTQFPYVETPLYDYYQYREKNVQVNNTNSETLGTVGSGNLSLSHVLPTGNHSGKSQYLYTQTELAAAGVTAGDIDAVLLNVVSNNTADAGYLRVKMKNTDKTSLSNTDIDADGFTEVYFDDYTFSPGSNRLQFYTPFSWDGTSNILIEFSFTNNTVSNALDVEGKSTGTTSGLYTTNNYCLDNVNGKIDIPAGPMGDISDEITISFWSYGNKKYQPIKNSIFWARDSLNKRQANLHLPWSDSKIYWDCGYEGGGYDRISKTATPQEYKGSWSHWAVTKNANTGEMKIYHNGTLWHSGSGKTKLIDITNFIFGTSGNYNRTWFGKIDEFRVWKKELDGQTIQDWMYRPVDATHPYYSDLVAYYPFDEGSGDTVNDASANAETAVIDGYMYWLFDRGNNLNRGFAETTERPNVTFAQGDYDLTVTDQIVTDSVRLTPNIVREYEIIPRYGTMLDDSINEVSVNEYWETQYEHTYGPDGTVIDSTLIPATDTIQITELEYFKRYPMKFEIMSFVTPYGIYLDLGMDGKTWAFDVTDYTPVLKGRKRMTVERGGQWQEDMDIRFLFIVGTPPRDVLDVQQIWRPDYRSYTAIMADRAFEPRDVQLNAGGKYFKIRSVITGHGQQGEFIPRWHYLNIDGQQRFLWKIWTECATNPIYPQGGTWIYDRAGWCPGKYSDLKESDITEFVTPGETVNIDYGLQTATGTSNYIVNNQLVTYGEANFNLDAAVAEILKPDAADARNIRFNPACSYPEIVIQNTGKNTLTTLDIDYYEEGGPVETFSWSGSLEFLEKDTVVLPVDELSFWLSTSNIFVATVKNPNGQQDENQYNNTWKTPFDGVDVFDENETIVIECKTNNYGWQTTYALYDESGYMLRLWSSLDDNTVYSDAYNLPAGCYYLRIDDSGQDGLQWWANPAQGSGYMAVKDVDGNFLHLFEPDFGAFEIYEFGIGAITSVKEINHSVFVSVYPNPATDHLNVMVKGAGSDKVTLRLSNTLSSVILDKTYTTGSEDFRTTLNISNLPSGIYFLQIESGSFTTVKKIVKR
ncbi:MAG: T9SS type A sorting domain-containing protein [Chlorobi bacterium]|nr:T9SS type A sorting domain-containing protein [Chlorobiota bacterium]